MDIRPQRTVDLKEYGAEGTIVLEPLDFRRRKQMQNNVGGCIDMSSSDSEQMSSQRVGDVMIYRVIAYIVSAPFKYESLDGFYKFMERLDRECLGNADRLFVKLNEKIKELEEEASSPLDKSPITSPQSNTE